MGIRQTPLHDRHDFYIVAGTSTATLLGSLFVAVTLNADLILAGSRPHLKRVAEQAFQNYITVVLSAFLFLFPRQNWAALANEVLVLGATTCVLAIHRFFDTRKITDEGFSRMRTWKRLLPSLLGDLVVAYSALHGRLQ